MQNYREIFSENGLLARTIEGFAPRPQQLAMAHAIGESLENLDKLIVEAGTGTGKTYAYLVPALLSGRRVIISTGTRTLQDQLFNRDLPTVASALGLPVRCALLKGRSNYLCLHRLGLTEQGPRRQTKNAQSELATIKTWSATTQAGDKSEVTSIPEDAGIWVDVTSTPDNCLGQDCADFARCHVVHARREAQAAEVVIVNHHLLMADLALKEEGFGELLPSADALIIDEAHQIPEIATQFFGISLSSRQLQDVARDTVAEMLKEAADRRYFETLTDALNKAVRDLRLHLGDPRGRIGWNELPAAANDALTRLAGTLDDLAVALGEVGTNSVGLDSCRRRVAECRARLDAIQADEQDNGLRWLDVTARGFALHITPFDIAETLNTIMSAHSTAWIFTSATLAVGEDFGHFADRIGVTDAQTLKLDSSFDYENNALLYLPQDIPQPGSEAYTHRVLDASIPVIRASAGGAFLLFTSYRALRDAAQVLSHELEFPLLVQGSAPREELLKRFRREKNAVLLGTASFWQGVDVRGEALTLVVIDKLPFAAPSDPVFKARLQAIERRGGNPFVEHQLPQAVISLKQGVGRLIRDVDDAGVVMICDPRLCTRSYGNVFLKSLPPMPVTDSLTEVERFFRAR